MELTPSQERIVAYVREHPGQLIVSTLGTLSMNQREFWDDVTRLIDAGILDKRTIDRQRHEGLWIA